MPKYPHKDQRAKFEETAKKLGCDEDEAAFDEKLKKVARARPKSQPKKG
jgi:hypothetical protein